MKNAWILALCAAAALGACGGGDDDVPAPAPPVTQQVPPAANTSVAAFIAYLKALVVADADMLEPVDVSTVTPATDDTIEPDAVN